MVNLPRHFYKAALSYLMIFSLLTSLMAYYIPVAYGAAGGLATVTLTDTDTAKAGIAGDLTVSWNVATVSGGTTFTRYDIYLVPAAENITLVGIDNYQPVLFNLNQISQNSIVLPESVTRDSIMPTPGNIVTGNYKACVLAETNPTNESLFTCSSSTAITADVVADTIKPHVNFIPVHTALDGNIHAVIQDDQTTTSQFSNAGDGGAEYIKLYYGVDISASEAEATCSNIAGNTYKCVIPGTITNLASVGNTFEYRWEVKDRAGNIKHLCLSPTATSVANCTASPFVATVASAGARSVAGNVKASFGGANISGAKVFAGGFAKAAVDTDASGNYTLSSLPSNTSVDIMVSKDSYCENGRFEPIGTSNLTDINFMMNTGSCPIVTADGATGSGKPHVVFSGPPSFSNNVPLTEKIRVGFDTALNPGTVNDSDATSNGDRIYLTTDDGTTKIAGSVAYCENNSSPGCSTIPSMDQNVILFTPGANLTANTSYTLVMTSGVASTTGQSIEGNNPGGGHKISFSTGGGVLNVTSENFSSGGAYMPPYVKSTSASPGSSIAANSNFIITFNDAMDSTTITDSNIVLFNSSNGEVAKAVTLDSSNKIVTINPTSNLTAGEYTVMVKGAVKNVSGVTARPAAESTAFAFQSTFKSSGTADATGPTIFPMLANNSTGVAVNQGFFEFGFNESIDPGTLTVSTVTMNRGSNAVPVEVRYDSGKNSAYIIPSTVLAPSTAYTITFSTSVTDLSGQALASAQTYTYTSGASESTAPKLIDFRTDEHTITGCFNEPLISETASGSNYTKSILNHANLTLKMETTADSGTFDAADLIGASTTTTWDPVKFCFTSTGLGINRANIGRKIKLTVESNQADLSGNVVGGTLTFINKIEDSQSTFGSFTDGGMFTPTMGESTAGSGVFKPEGFGSFTSEQFAFGQADMAFPFNPTAGQDSNVFEVRFTPGVALADNDQVVLTFPTGTTITNAAPATGPFFTDMNEFAAGTIAFDTDFGGDGVAVDTATKTVTVQLAVTGSPPSTGPITIQSKGIFNPAIPKDPSTGGYTVGIKVIRNSTSLVNKTSMPYFITAGGTNTINLKVFAGTSASPVNGANGTVYLFAGGPSGPMNKKLTLTNGIISAIDGTVGTVVSFTNLNDGCYFFGTEPLVTLGGTDYFGKHSPEPVCVSGGETVNKTTDGEGSINLTAASGGTVHTITVKFAGIGNFNGADIDIFAGGPNKFVVKTLSAVGAPNGAGYSLNIPANGQWSIGFGPAMSKTGTASMPKPLACVPTSPVQLVVSGIGGSPTATMPFPSPNVAFDAGTNTLTFTCAAADKTITGTVSDGATGLQDIEVFMHSQGFGQPTFTKTSSSGAFTVNVSDYGAYQIGAFGSGLPPRSESIEVRLDGADAGTSPDIFFLGKQITDANPLIIKLNKPAFYISGKMLDASGNGIGYAPVSATDANGEFVHGMTSSDGSYTLFVGVGTWTVTGKLPPDKTSDCGSYTTTVIITSDSKTSQNISPTAGTCYTISGTVTIGGSTKANVPVFVEEWNTVTNKPAGGLFRPTTTNSSGVYSVKVSDAKTYRVGTWSQDFGEISATYAVSGANKTDAHVNSGSTSTITFAFTGGSANHEAFVEVKKSDDAFTRFGKNQRGLNSNMTFNVKDGTYNYFVNVFGVGDFTGTVSAGSTATIDLSATTLITISGNVNDAAGTDLSGVLITAKDSTTGKTQTAVTDSNGDYTMKVKTGTYEITDSASGYIPGEGKDTVIVTADKDYDIGGADPEKDAMEKANRTIEGVISESDASTADAGFVQATNAEGITVVAPVDPQDGTYSLPVTDGTWTVKAAAPLHSRTTLSGGAVTVSGSDLTSKNITLTADASNTTVSATESVSADTGGTVNDTNNTGIKLTAGPGVLEAGSSDVQIAVDRTFDAPETTSVAPLGGATFGITATSASTIKDLNGNAEIQLDYSSLVADLPSGVDEAELSLVYYSPEKNEYIPVEGGFVVDQTNNTITGHVDHFTDFAIVYAPPAAVVASPSPSPSGGGSSGGGGGGGGGLTTSSKSKTVATETETETDSAETTDSKVKFKDTEKHWAKDYIQSLYEKGIVSGYNAENYGPDNKITRAEFTKIVIEMFDIELPETAATSTFKDIKSTEWYAPYVDAALENELVLGYNDKTFRPNQPINRAEAMKILLEASGMELETDYVASFPDLDKKAWYIAYINFAAENGIVSGYGDGKFGPANNLTRGEVAKIASLMLEMAEEEEEPVVSSFSPTELIKSVLK